jgi:DNA repair protein RadC
LKHEVGSIQVTAELKDEEAEKITSTAGVTEKYGFLRERPKEHFYAVFLKSDNEVIGDKLIGLGTTGSAPADLKDIARTGVLTNASAVILVHNHPSNNDSATPDDKRLTQKIQRGLEIFDIKVLDHVIITQTGHYSMKQAGDI